MKLAWYVAPTFAQFKENLHLNFRYLWSEKKEEKLVSKKIRPFCLFFGATPLFKVHMQFSCSSLNSRLLFMIISYYLLSALYYPAGFWGGLIPWPVLARSTISFRYQQNNYPWGNSMRKVLVTWHLFRQFHRHKNTQDGFRQQENMDKSN